MKFEIVCCMAAHDMQVYNHLVPIAMHPDLKRLWLVRAARIHRSIPKTEYAIAASKFLPLRLWRCLRECIRLGRRPEVLAFVSFNPLPYGLIARFAGWVCGKPVHYGFIGLDWVQYGKHGWGRPFMPILRRGDFITTTGDQMRREMIEYGFDARKIRILPHGIDVQHFELNDPNNAEFDFLFAGRLVPIKCIDVILRAMALVLKEQPRARLCLVGEGECHDDLVNLARQLEIDEAVTFAGYSTEVTDWMGRARCVLIASENEGFPFALAEGMCSGLVPVSTPVGSIPEFIRDGENGLLFPVGDHNTLSRHMLRLMNEPALYTSLRDQAVKIRNHVSYSAAARVWEDWFAELNAGGRAFTTDTDISAN